MAYNWHKNAPHLSRQRVRVNLCYLLWYVFIVRVKFKNKSIWKLLYSRLDLLVCMITSKEVLELERLEAHWKLIKSLRFYSKPIFRSSALICEARKYNIVVLSITDA